MKLSLKQKAAGIILLLALALTAAAGTVSYRVYAGTMDAHYRLLTGNIARTAAAVVDGDEAARCVDAVTQIYLEDPAPEFGTDEAYQAYLARYDAVRDEGYLRLLQTLERVRQTNGALSLYISYMDPGSMTGVYVLDASEDACPAGAWDIIYPQNYEAMERPEEGFAPYITDTEEYGWLCSAGAPVFTGDGRVAAHVFVDISMDAVMRDRQEYLFRLCAILLLVTALLALAFIRLVNAGLVRPINALARAAASYVEDKAHSGASALAGLSIRTGDEVENLWEAMRRMEEDINTYIEDLTRATSEKERIGAELNVATHIQASMLPCIFPAFPERPEFDIYASMDPAKEVGGDFYDFFLVDEDHLAVVVADVSGKGVPAALFMVIAKTLIKDHAQTGTPPEEVFTEVNRQLCESNEEGLFVTAWMGVLELSSGRLTFVNAGHNPPLLRQGGGDFAYLRTRPGFVLAGLEGTRYRSGSLILSPGDTLYLYTDGVTEATDSELQLYGEERLQAVLNAGRDLAPRELLAAVKADVDAFAGEAPQFDDITMLALRCQG